MIVVQNKRDLKETDKAQEENIHYPLNTRKPIKKTKYQGIPRTGNFSCYSYLKRRK